MPHLVGFRRPNGPRRTACRGKLLAAFLGILAFAAAGSATSVRFDIPAQSVPATLHLFIQQSAAEVVYNLKELEKLDSNGVKGVMEPADALRILLEGTGYMANRTESGNFVVTKAPGQNTGSLRGLLVWPSNEPAEGVIVLIHETGQSTQTDKFGQYYFPSVPSGHYLLVASADGYQPMHIVDVGVSANQELTLGKETMRKAEDVTKLEAYVVAAEEVTQLEKYEVSDTKPKPFSDADVDLPRGIDDAQPYYVFDRTMIEQSGATTVDDFFRTRIPMDVTKEYNGQAILVGSAGAPGTAIDQSSINISNFGSDQTLILVDGHRLPNISANGTFGLTSSSQPDINGIPLAAIDRIEVLPASASAIYGASAVGGVVNIILRQDYAGAELKATYEDSYKGSSPIRQISLSVGAGLDHGRTHLMLTLSDTSSDPLDFGERANILLNYRQRAYTNDPNLVDAPGYGSTPLGSTPNYTADPGFQLVNGQSVVVPGSLFGPGTSNRAFLPVGYTGTNLGPVQANAGSYNLQPPAEAEGTSPWFGLTYPMGDSIRITAADLNLRRQFLPRLELFIELNHSVNASYGHQDPAFAQDVEVGAAIPDNIFHTNVQVTAPFSTDTPADQQKMTNDQFVGGFKLKLPDSWISEGDYTFGRTTTNYSGGAFDNIELESDIESGAYNVFQDLVTKPSDARYAGTYVGADKSLLVSGTLRAAGPVLNLPAGDVTAAFGAGYQREGSGNGYYETTWLMPHSYFGEPAVNSVFANDFAGLAQIDDDAYGELDVPLISKRNALPGVAQLDLQLAGRADFYKVLFKDASESDPEYDSSNETIGIRYRPIRDVLLRGSFSSAFQPPSYSQLTPIPPPFAGMPSSLAMYPSGWPPTVVADPERGGEVNSTAGASTGGNPDLKPETSKDIDFGIVLEPRFLPGLHFSVDYAQIKKHNDIQQISPQVIVDNEADFPGRVVRGPLPPGDPFSVGPITFIDGTFVNLLNSSSETYNIALNYEWHTSHFGKWSLFSTFNSEQHYLVQLAPGQPSEEEVNNPLGSLMLEQSKFTGDGGVNWNRGAWSAGWSTRFYGDYRVSSVYEKAQGSPYVNRQVYHDVYLGYAFHARRSAAWWARSLSGSSIQIGAKNVFNTAPAYDASQISTFYSYYGDIRMGSYYISVKKEF
jgi:iron complex outermembrane recepter protein